ncbi:MAG: hypothetical protein CM15mP74_02240 [Halieaceae bacterium]|nr:MAG: hypothetical protein CM15mP74_02240 [Halieaceae bacterium]
MIKGIVSTEDGSLQLDGIVSLSQVGYDVSLSAKGPVAKDEGFSARYPWWPHPRQTASMSSSKVLCKVVNVGCDT